MAINNRLVTEFVDRLTPYVKQGVKKLEVINERYFKPTEETAEEFMRNMEAKGAEYDEIAPFAQRLITPELFGMNPAINRVRAVVRNTRKMLSQTKDDKVCETFTNLYNKIMDNTSNITGLSDVVVTLMQKTELVDNPKIKNSILSYLDSMVKRPKKTFCEYFKQDMTLMEKLADTTNILNDKYLRTDGKTVKFYKFMKKRDAWLLDVIEGTKKGEADYRKRFISTSAGTKKYEDYLESFEEYSTKNVPKTFENDLKADSIRNFIDTYVGGRYSKAIDVLYHEEYLKTLPKDIAVECAEIKKTYGTYVIPTNGNITAEDMKYLKEELRLWKEAGKGEEVLPRVINVDILDEFMIKNNCVGCTDMYYETVDVLELLGQDGKHDSVGSTLRHELQHLQDEYNSVPKNTFQNLHEKLKWLSQKILHKKEWKKELMTNGGIDKYLFKYAMSDPAELLSVTAESRMQNLSEAYKNRLQRKFHMKNWIFNIGENQVAADSRRKDLARHLTEEAMKNMGA